MVIQHEWKTSKLNKLEMKFLLQNSHAVLICYEPYSGLRFWSGRPNQAPKIQKGQSWLKTQKIYKLTKLTSIEFNWLRSVQLSRLTGASPSSTGTKRSFQPKAATELPALNTDGILWNCEIVMNPLRAKWSQDCPTQESPHCLAASSNRVRCVSICVRRESASTLRPTFHESQKLCKASTCQAHFKVIACHLVAVIMLKWANPCREFSFKSGNARKNSRPLKHWKLKTIQRPSKKQNHSQHLHIVWFSRWGWNKQPAKGSADCSSDESSDLAQTF